MVAKYWNAKAYETLTDDEFRAIANNEHIIIERPEGEQGRRVIYNDPSRIPEFEMMQIVNRLNGAIQMKAFLSEQTKQKPTMVVIDVDALIDEQLDWQEVDSITDDFRQELLAESVRRITNFCFGVDENLRMVVHYAWQDVMEEGELTLEDIQPTENKSMEEKDNDK